MGQSQFGVSNAPFCTPTQSFAGSNSGTDALSVEILEAETAFRIEQWLKDLARVLGAEVLVTDDGSTESPRSADGLKTVADHLGLKHQICRAHVNRNVHDLIA